MSAMDRVLIAIGVHTYIYIYTHPFVHAMPQADPAKKNASSILFFLYISNLSSHANNNNNNNNNNNKHQRIPRGGRAITNRKAEMVMKAEIHPANKVTLRFHVINIMSRAKNFKVRKSLTDRIYVYGREVDSGKSVCVSVQYFMNCVYYREPLCEESDVLFENFVRDFSNFFSKERIEYDEMESHDLMGYGDERRYYRMYLPTERMRKSLTKFVEKYPYYDECIFEKDITSKVRFMAESGIRIGSLVELAISKEMLSEVRVHRIDENSSEKYHHQYVQAILSEVCVNLRDMQCLYDVMQVKAATNSMSEYCRLGTFCLSFGNDSENKKHVPVAMWTDDLKMDRGTKRDAYPPSPVSSATLIVWRSGESATTIRVRNATVKSGEKKVINRSNSFERNMLLTQSRAITEDDLWKTKVNTAVSQIINRMEMARESDNCHEVEFSGDHSEVELLYFVLRFISVYCDVVVGWGLLHEYGTRSSLSYVFKRLHMNGVKGVQCGKWNEVDSCNVQVHATRMVLDSGKSFWKTVSNCNPLFLIPIIDLFDYAVKKNEDLRLIDLTDYHAWYTRENRITQELPLSNTNGTALRDEKVAAEDICRMICNISVGGEVIDESASFANMCCIDLESVWSRGNTHAVQSSILTYCYDHNEPGSGKRKFIMSMREELREFLKSNDMYSSSYAINTNNSNNNSGSSSSSSSSGGNDQDFPISGDIGDPSPVHSTRTVLPSKKYGSKAKYRGGLVLDLDDGKRVYDEPLMTLDFSSMYNTLYIYGRLCYTNMVGVTSDNYEHLCDLKKSGKAMMMCIDTNSHVYVAFIQNDSRELLLPKIMARNIGRRSEIKQAINSHGGDKSITKRLKSEEKSIKRWMQCFYGVGGAEEGPLSNVVLACIITRIGRVVLMDSLRFTERSLCYYHNPETHVIEVRKVPHKIPENGQDDDDGGNDDGDEGEVKLLRIGQSVSLPDHHHRFKVVAGDTDGISVKLEDSKSCKCCWSQMSTIASQICEHVNEHLNSEELCGRYGWDARGEIPMKLSVERICKATIFYHKKVRLMVLDSGAVECKGTWNKSLSSPPMIARAIGDVMESMIKSISDGGASSLTMEQRILGAINESIYRVLVCAEEIKDIYYRGDMREETLKSLSVSNKYNSHAAMSKSNYVPKWKVFVNGGGGGGGGCGDAEEYYEKSNNKITMNANHALHAMHRTRFDIPIKYRGQHIEYVHVLPIIKAAVAGERDDLVHENSIPDIRDCMRYRSVCGKNVCCLDELIALENRSGDLMEDDNDDVEGDDEGLLLNLSVDAQAYLNMLLREFLRAVDPIMKEYGHDEFLAEMKKKFKEAHIFDVNYAHVNTEK